LTGYGLEEKEMLKQLWFSTISLFYPYIPLIQ